MFIKVKDLELRKMTLDGTFTPGVIDLGQEIQQNTPLQVAGRAELIQENRGARDIVEDIRLVGDFSTQVTARCARCLEPVSQDVKESFDLLYRPLGVDAKGDDNSLGRAETEIGYYEGEGLLLEDILKEQILLALPVRMLCLTGCKGLCPHCGRNLNVESCDCAASPPDVRWTALEDIRRKLEQ